MSEIIYGRNPILEALRAGQELEVILISESMQGPKTLEIQSLAKRKRVPIKNVPASKIVQLAGNSKTQGLAAFVTSQLYVTLNQILERATQCKEPPLVALLDGIENPHNLGAILRSADGAGAHGVIIPNRRSVAVTATVAKSSAGAAAHILTSRVSNLSQVIDKLKADNVWIVGADQNAKQAYFEADLSGGVGIVIGGEGRGMRRLIKERCDFLVKIPMFGRVNSLNASVAAALLLFEARRQRQAKLNSQG
ncbi:23S rRNA (guanosine(2251)-2'-O)-methyltransferase RlmB [bacterium]|nr:23S rRNA (guanosine(2251)-2'-O)-methyltransferase RlmB [bacterium]